MEAIIYARYSSLEQGRGSSLERQEQLCRAYCDRKQWAVSAFVCDKGTSAWTGANMDAGNLAELTKKLERDGGVDKVIVVEQLDRISRRPPLEVMGWLTRLTATGAALATVNDNLIIDAHSLQNQPMNLVSTVFNSFRAFSESQHKSERLASAWAIKRQSDQPMTSRTVAWVELVDGELTLIQDRAAIVKEIFEASADGTGAESIAKKLNLRGVEPWGRADGWRASYIKKILSNRAVIGEYQPMLAKKGQARKPAGEPRRDYYPPAISDELFLRVKNRSRHISHAKGRKLNNLLSGIGVCGTCYGKMTRINKSNKWEYLRCEKSRRGMCEHRRNYPLGPVTDKILDHILHRAMDATSFQNEGQVSALKERLASLKIEVADLEARKARLLVLVEDGDIDATNRYRALGSDLEVAKAQRDEAERALSVATQMPDKEYLKRVSEVRSMIDSEDDVEREQARVKVKAALDSVIEEVSFHGDNGFAIMLKNGVGAITFRDWESTTDHDFPIDGDKLSPDIMDYLARREGELRGNE